MAEIDWRTDVLASEAGVSQRSLSRLFRAGLDVSPADFVERLAMGSRTPRREGLPSAFIRDYTYEWIARLVSD